MATDWRTFPLEFKGGLISNLSPLQQGTNAVGSATVLENFEPSLSGGYKKIKGFLKFNANGCSETNFHPKSLASDLARFSVN